MTLSRYRARSSSLVSLAAPLWMAAAFAAEPPRDAKDLDQHREQSSLSVTATDPEAAAAADAEDEQEAQKDDDEEGQGGPGQYQVQPGDTIWDLCDRYFHDPWRWPKVWAQNPDITNPHWIFPGQMINLGGMTRSVPVAATKGPTTGRDTGLRAVTRAAPPATTAGLLREVGFVDAKELPFAGTIDGSREEKIMLATGDQAYVAFSRDRPLRAGQRLTIYQVDTDHPVREPHSAKLLGYLVHIYGDLSIDSLTDRPVASATLLDVVAPVERGYRVGPLFRQFKMVKPRPSAVDATAQVVAAVQPNILIAEGMFVVLDRGSRQGVEVGNRFTVVRQGDGYRGVMEDGEASDHAGDLAFPPDRIADVMAVDVREETAIGWVVGGNRSIRLGDRAEMRKGR